METFLYSIGHGHKTVEEFIAELQAYGVEYLVDVRSAPFSKWAPHFNQGYIEHVLNEHGIKYIYMGDSIGGRPLNDSCYDEDGFFDYQRMAAIPQFQEGIQRLIKANDKKCITAVMCSETDPSQCHRSKLIGRELLFEHDIDMQHIISCEKTLSETEVIVALTKGSWSPEPNLFEMWEGANRNPYFKSCHSYKKEIDIDFQYD